MPVRPAQPRARRPDAARAAGPGRSRARPCLSRLGRGVAGLAAAAGTVLIRTLAGVARRN